MSAFTPGPWRLAGWKHGMSTGLLGPTPDKRLGTIHTGSDEYVANAHLIAASPELYEALDEALAFIAVWGATYQFQHELPEVHPAHAETLAKAQAALALARGEVAP